MKRYIKKIVCIMVIVVIFLLLKNVSLAYDYNFESSWMNNGNSNIVKPTKNITDNIVKIIRIVGTGISIIMVSYIGIKYMSSSPSEKADYKKTAVPFVVGAAILFGTTSLLEIIYNFANNVTQ